MGVGVAFVLRAFVAAGLLLPSMAFAANLPLPAPSNTFVPCWGTITGVTCTVSTTQHETDIRVNLPVITTYSTRVLSYGAISGLGISSTTTAFDQTTPHAPGSTDVNALFGQASAAARATAISLAAGRPYVTIIENGPILTDSSISSTTLQVGHTLAGGPSPATTYTVDAGPPFNGSGTATFDVPAQPNGQTLSVTVSVTIAPGTVITGGGQHVDLFLPAGSPDNFNLDEHIETFYEDDYQTTVTNSATYAITDTLLLQLIGTIYPDLQGTLEDGSSDFMKKLRAVADQGVVVDTGARINLAGVAAPKVDGGWMEAYGTWSSTPTQGMIPGDSSLSGGVRAGLTAKLGDRATAGFGFDQGFGVVTVPDAAESATVTHTQVGLHASIDLDPVTLDFAAVAGLGHIDASHGSAALGGVSTGSFDFRTAGLSGELGYKLDRNGWTVTPLMGGDLSLVHADAFTETGPTALTVAAADALRLRAWLGLTVSRSMTLANGEDLDLGFTTRLIDTVAGAGHSLPVALAGTPMSLDGLRDAPLALEGTFNVALHVTPHGTLSLDVDGMTSSTGATSLAAHAAFRGTF